ncbi:thioredoxin family protein [Fluoribacter dumoffii]|uniref:Thiol-disulfide oxidoreductase n=1 Tax=Fluoribacter dumoffii TaxID=463 RepID=A0A377GEX5_9GAMM|nr:thioredoxin family protein [Fluoribacter dumoffii]KTC91415.1 putative thiol-disulfide isomerase [Fluoribacter dumoffii NY 23]MCW8387455.1 thioredoxin family protein [Fluoribacter dumoffii]MCW8417037.1 thioredoxin family protein [Fluoribacter dumoffii]MCW8455123.1 thioredoxin family protein [Fluoribacter dumoffii]MCW8460800.1 thioredoxin family protein [Fluoribacter dumoffii]
MVATASTMLPLGSKAPDFTLVDTRNNQLVSLEHIKSPIATVIMFLCNHCPYVKHVQAKIVELAEIYQAKGIRFIAISSNDAEKYPADGPEQMRLEAENCGYSFPYLYDETQEVAKAYKAACTPDFYIFDKDMLCVYRGCLDESTPGNNKPVTGSHLQSALDNILAGTPVHAEQKPSLGCNIKWK